jgi:hypothetical protein
MDIFSILSILAIAGATPQASVAQAPADPAPAAVAPDPWAPKQFLYYRAIAFRGMVAGQMCGGGPVRAEFHALSARLEKARKILSKKSHSARFDRKEDTVPRAPQCSDGEAGFMLSGFQNAVAELELAAK